MRGVEVSLRDGYHVLALFDPSVGRDHVVSFLGAVGLRPDDYGKHGTVCTAGADEVFLEIHKANGLAILSHIDCPKGAFACQTKEKDGKITVPQECCHFFNTADYDGVETITGGLPKSFDAIHNFSRFPAVVRSSDNPSPTNPSRHSKLGVGSKYTWLKMDEISLRGLKQCLLDPGTRICVDDLCPSFSSPWIKTIELQGGFFNGQKIHFRPGLNALIGAQGSGKSLLVEFLRFSLGQLCNRHELRDDTMGKLRKRLGPRGTVVVTVNKDGRSYNITRSLPAQFPASVSRCWDEIESSTPTVTGEDLSTLAVSPQMLFPIQAYSQGEIVLVAREPGAQRKLIDESLDLSELENLRTALQGLLNINTEALSPLLATDNTIEAVESALITEREAIKSLSDKLKSDWFTKIEKWRDADRARKALRKEIDEVEDIVSDWAQDSRIAEIKRPATQPNVTPENTGEIAEVALPPQDAEQSDSETSIIIDQFSDCADRTRAAARQGLSALSTQIGVIKAQAKDLSEQWKIKLAKTELDYESFLSTVGGDKKKLDSLLKQHRAKESELERRLKDEKANQQKRLELVAERNKLLDQFCAVRQNVAELRQRHYGEVSLKTDQLLQIGLEADGDRSAFVGQIANLMKGSGRHTTTFESLCSKISPRELADTVLFQQPETAANDAAIEGISRETVEDIIRSLKQQPNKTILELPYLFPCEDRPIIRYKVEDGSYRDLDQLSAGQKMTALQMIILSVGDQPVLIDQPEDSIDTERVPEHSQETALRETQSPVHPV